MSATSERERRARAGWAEAARMARKRSDAAAGESWPSSRFDAEEWEWESMGDDVQCRREDDVDPAELGTVAGTVGCA